MKMQQLPKENLPAAYKFSKLYGGKRSLEYFRNKYANNPELFVACFDRGKLIGICWGFPRGKEIILFHIAVDADRWRKGVGKKLLTCWEKQAKKTGKKKISLGAATKPMNVVGFYRKSGYRAVKKKPGYVVMEKKI